MKAVKGHCRIGQVLGGTGDERLGHVHAEHFNGFGLALVGFEVFCKALHRTGVFAGRGVDQFALWQVVHQRDVALPFSARGLINTDDLCLCVAFFGACQIHVSINLSPQGVVRTAQDARAG